MDSMWKQASRLICNRISFINFGLRKLINYHFQFQDKCGCSSVVLGVWCCCGGWFQWKTEVFSSDMLEYNTPLINSFIHNLFSHQCNDFRFFFSSSRHVSAANGHHQVWTTLKLSHCIKCSLIHIMCKSDASCLIYLMYTRYLFALINFICFLI
jgi:hypothetical protein